MILRVVLKLIFKMKYFIQRLFYYFSREKKSIVVFRKVRNNTDKTRVELGGGETPSFRNLGFLNVDLRDLACVDIKSSAWGLKLADFPNGIDYLYSRHMIEHLASYELVRAINNWKTLLNDNAILELIVPNIEFHSLQYLSSKYNSNGYRHAMAGFNGWQRCECQNYWDIHKSSFDCQELSELLNRNFNVIKLYFDKSNPKNIHVICQISVKSST